MSKELDGIAAEMLELFGEGQEKEELHLSFGYPPLNKILSGDYVRGLPYGRVTEVFGPPASGKTLLATMAMIEGQRAGGMAIFCDWECAFSQKFAEEIGLNVAHPYFMKITPETFEGGIQKAFTIAEYVRKKKAIPDVAPIVIVFDSIAAAVPKSVMYDSKGVPRSVESRNMNDNLALAKATSSTLPQVAQMARKYNVVTIFLNQLRERPGVVYGDPTYTPGGKTPEFVATTRLQVTSKKIMEEVAGGKEFKGRLIEFKTMKSKATRPFQTMDIRLTYNDEGKAQFDYTYGLIGHLLDIGKLKVDGKMIVWEGKKYYISVLAKKIDEEGKYAELIKLLHT